VREADSALKSTHPSIVVYAHIANRCIELSRTLTTLKNNHNETLSTHSSTAHASEIATLDTQKFRIAKAASDIEIESERLSSQLVDLQARLQELEMQGVDGGDNARRGPVADELSLKLKLFRSLGIEARRGEGVGYNEVVIEKSTDGGPQVFTLKEKFSSFYKANHIWEVL